MYSNSLFAATLLYFKMELCFLKWNLKFDLKPFLLLGKLYMCLYDFTIYLCNFFLLILQTTYIMIFCIISSTNLFIQVMYVEGEENLSMKIKNYLLYQRFHFIVVFPNFLLVFHFPCYAAHRLFFRSFLSCCEYAWLSNQPWYLVLWYFLSLYIFYRRCWLLK